MGKEHRVARRVQPRSDRPIEIQVMSQGFLDIFEARDISVTGVGIYVPYRFEGCDLTNPADLVITLPKQRPFLARGELVHRTKAEREFFGIEFVDLDPAQEKLIDEYVERHLEDALE